ncbi:rhamnan synthesis F family protein [Ancylobacter sp.]|uniref:rhamnan synthesis F family protein n=1 Tax=Ancylobacter sp. TaxID=1872567 RepID=UPI003D109A74
MNRPEPPLSALPPAPDAGDAVGRRRYFVPKQRGKVRRTITAYSQKIGRLFNRLLFEADGRPGAVLRTLLFDAYHRPRPAFEAIVFKKPGWPRRAFAPWLEQADDALAPLVAGLEFPAAPPPGRRRVFVIVEADAAPARDLARHLGHEYEVVVLRLDGPPPGEAATTPASEVAVAVAGRRVPRAVLVEALALRAYQDRPFFAVTIGGKVADAADAFERRNVPVVAVVDPSEAGLADMPELALERLLDRASAVVFPSEAVREAALAALPQFAARRRRVAVAGPLTSGVATVCALGREIGAELDNERALAMSMGPARLEMLTLPREKDPPGLVSLEARLERAIAAWRHSALLHLNPNRPPLRRNCSGFHALIYAEHHPVACFDQRRYPLSHWVERGRPDGPWTLPVFGPLAAPAPSRLKAGLHGHFFYTDLLPELLERVAANAARPDLFLTTDTAEKADDLRALTAAYPAPVRVDVVPNLGRDIGPFLTALRDALTGGGYDVFFHVHGKKTKGRRRAIGDPWRSFLWENLIGGQRPMIDSVLACLEADPRLGLVYPEDVNLLDWARNGRIADELRADLGIAEPAGTYVDFPVGNMFAVRPAALAGILALDLQWDDYPPEPIPLDGTVMHGVERLLPMAVRKAGFGVAAIRVPGTDWE